MDKKFCMSRRNFLRAAGAAGALGLGGGTAYHLLRTVDVKGHIVIIGGGAAGCSMAARVQRRIAHPHITLVDPAERQYYQPGFTFVASGIFKPAEVWEPMADCIPSGVKWVKDAVVEVDPVRRRVALQGGEVLEYDFLVLTPGLQINWSQVEGISEATLGQGNAHCIYSFEGAQRIWPAIQELVERGGRGLFTDTYTKHKCGGAPKKICMLTEHLARKRGRREGVQLDYFCSEKALYDVPHYTPRLLELYQEKGIGLEVRHRLKAVDTQARKAFFEQYEVKKLKVVNPATGREEVVEKTEVTGMRVEEYDLLSLVPPQSAPDFVRRSGLSWTEGKLARDGWAMVDQKTLTHIQYPNIVCLGDVAGIPTSKTSSAIRIQLPIAEQNLLQMMQGHQPTHHYNGYACCPIVTDYDHVLMCEFDYQKQPCPSFPFTLMDTSRELSSGMWLKRHFLKPMFFRGMLTGWM